MLSLVLLGSYGCASSEAEYWYNRGVSDHHGPDSKISHFTRAIELKPDYAVAYITRGNAYNNKGLSDEAIADLTKAITLLKMKGDKHHLALAHNNLGFAYKIKGQYDRAIRDYTEAIRLEPDYAIAYTNRGDAYRKKGLHDKAIADANKAITLLEMKGDKHYLAVAYLSRGNSYRENGSHERAIADANKAIELDPEYTHAYNHLAWLLATAPDAVLRNGKRAVELAWRAADLDWNAQNLDTLAAAYAEVGRFEDAIERQLQAIARPKIEIDENSMVDFQMHLERYRNHKPWRMNEPGGGPDYTTMVIKLNDLAEQYRAQGKVAEAEPLYKRALAIREKARQQEEARKRALEIREKVRRQEEARKRERQQRLEALSGRYVADGGRSQWDISFRDNRFEARILNRGKWDLLYDGTVTGTRISGRVHHGSSSICRQSPTAPLTGNVYLRRKAFEIFWRDYNLVEMTEHKRCVPTTARRKWTQGDRQ